MVDVFRARLVATDALADQIAGMLHDGAALHGLRLKHASWRPGSGLRASYAASVIDPDGGPVLKRPLRVQWLLEAPAAPLPDPPVVPATAGPFQRLHSYDAEAGVDIAVWPFDRAFPHLASAGDPVYAAGLIAEAEGWAPAGNARPWSVRPLRYVPGHSHVLAYAPSSQRGSPPGPGSVIAKLAADADACARHGAAIRAVAEGLEQAPGTARASAPFGDTAGAGILLYRWAAGPDLASHLRRGTADLALAFGVLGATVRALHALAPPPGIPVAGLDRVLGRAARETSALEDLAPGLARQADALLQRCAQAMEAWDAEPATTAHGDLKAEHARWPATGELTVIDLDSICCAEPALDLGQMLADLRLVNSSRTARESARGAFLEGYWGGGPAVGGVPASRRRRATAYELAALVRGVIRRAHLWQPGWEQRVRAGLGEASQLAAAL